jgi:hypothetical protein
VKTYAAQLGGTMKQLNFLQKVIAMIIALPLSYLLPGWIGISIANDPIKHKLVQVSLILPLFFVVCLPLIWWTKRKAKAKN